MIHLVAYTLATGGEGRHGSPVAGKREHGEHHFCRERVCDVGEQLRVVLPRGDGRGCEEERASASGGPRSGGVWQQLQGRRACRGGLSRDVDVTCGGVQTAA